MDQPRVETLRLSSKLTVTVLYEDRYFMAIDKPSGYLVAPKSWENTSRNLMLMLQEGVERGTPWARRRMVRFIANVHRLDADTSGVLLLAKNRPALVHMTARFEQRRVDKVYIALVEGSPQKDQFSAEVPLSQQPNPNGRMFVDRQDGREALTKFTVLERLENYTLVRAEPVTGRTHQIRVHLSWLGFPVVSDPIYGSKPAADEEENPRWLPIDRLALHAAELKFKHPLLHHPVHIIAPLPKDFLKAIEMLKRHRDNLSAKSAASTEKQPPTVKPAATKSAQQKSNPATNQSRIEQTKIEQTKTDQQKNTRPKFNQLKPGPKPESNPESNPEQQKAIPPRAAAKTDNSQSTNRLRESRPKSAKKLASKEAKKQRS